MHPMQAYSTHCMVMMQTVVPVAVAVMAVMVVAQMIAVVRMPVVVGVMHMRKWH